jgi:hypothetical protein
VRPNVVFGHLQTLYRLKTNNVGLNLRNLNFYPVQRRNVLPRNGGTLAC